MQLQLYYICDVCENKFLLDFKECTKAKKIQCPSCQVVYNFSEEDLLKFNECYSNFGKKMKQSKEKSN